VAPLSSASDGPHSPADCGGRSSGGAGRGDVPELKKAPTAMSCSGGFTCRASSSEAGCPYDVARSCGQANSPAPSASRTPSTCPSVRGTRRTPGWRRRWSGGLRASRAGGGRWAGLEGRSWPSGRISRRRRRFLKTSRVLAHLPLACADFQPGTQDWHRRQGSNSSVVDSWRVVIQSATRPMMRPESLAVSSGSCQGRQSVFSDLDCVH
jgi:hypothetical protein